MLARPDIEIAVPTSLPSDAEIERAGDAYLAGFSGPPYYETGERRAEFVDRVRRYASRDGFRLVVLRERGAPAGIGLAVVAHPGDWWREQVAAVLTPREIAAWLGDAVLEVVHIAVRLESRGRGLGARIHDVLLEDAAAPTAILSADRDPTPARNLYATRGWTVLRDSFVPGDGEPVALLVRRLDGVLGSSADPLAAS